MAESAVEAGHLDDEGENTLRDDALVTATIVRHEAALLRTARRHSLCADDAQDAYQRALEIFLTRAGRLRRETAVNWLHQVVKHEAMAVRAQRQQLVAGEDVDLDARVAEDVRSPEEWTLSTDRTAHAVEAFAGLKPQEVTALLLKAEGLSYQEIAERQSWTYTKVNRCITEGRRAFLTRFAGIESGAECERFAPVLAALAAGEADARRLRELRPHLRRCRACRATVRELRAGRRSAGFFAAPPLVAWALRRLRVLAQAAPGAKAAAVVASAVVVAGGSVAVRDAHPRPHHPHTHAARAVARRPPAPVRPVAVAAPTSIATPRATRPARRRPAKRAVRHALVATPASPPRPPAPATTPARTLPAPADTTRPRRPATPEFGVESG